MRAREGGCKARQEDARGRVRRVGKGRTQGAKLCWVLMGAATAARFCPQEAAGSLDPSQGGGLAHDPADPDWAPLHHYLAQLKVAMGGGRRQIAGTAGETGVVFHGGVWWLTGRASGRVGRKSDGGGQGRRVVVFCARHVPQRRWLLPLHALLCGIVRVGWLGLLQGSKGHRRTGVCIPPHRTTCTKCFATGLLQKFVT